MAKEKETCDGCQNETNRARDHKDQRLCPGCLTTAKRDEKQADRGRQGFKDVKRFGKD